MKLTGYYMTAICKFEDGIKTICVVDAQNRAQMLERSERGRGGHPEPATPAGLQFLIRWMF